MTGNPKPDRPADEERHGSGKAPREIQATAEHAYYAELYVDALGNFPEAPNGWWHLKLWKGP